MEQAQIDEIKRPRFGAPWIWAAGVALVGALVLLQVQLMKPDFASERDYFVKEGAKLKAGAYALGPSAKVGWQRAEWIGWRLPSGELKLELVKFDRDDRPSVQAIKDSDIRDGVPFIQAKVLRPGDRQNKYDGPSMAAVRAAVERAPKHPG
jgi:hypothetical protein